MNLKKTKSRGHFRYGFAELAKLFETTEAGIRQAASRGYFDPKNLKSVFEYYEKRRMKRDARG